MKPRFPPLIAALSIANGTISLADSTIQSGGSFAYSANAGWIDFRPDVPSAPEGVVFGDFFLSGFAYAANFGWIHLGDGSPADGIRYQNESATDFGINHDGAGNLSGYAYAANVGWIDFGWAGPTDPNRPRVDLATGAFAGFAYGANIGWINLGTGLVTSSMVCIDDDNDGISDAWERDRFGDTGTATATSNQDGDAMSDLDEFGANTDPNDPASVLGLTLTAIDPAFHEVSFEVTHGAGRFVEIETGTGLDGWDPLADYGLRSAVGTISDSRIVPVATTRFFRVRATKPLQP